MASHRIAPAPALVSSFSARCACGYTPENAPGSSRSSRNSPGHFFAKALLRGKTGWGPDDGIGSAEWGEPGPPLSASDAGAVRAASRCARSGVPAALPQSQGLRPLSLVHLLLLADAQNPRRRFARTALSSAGGGPTTLRRGHRRTDMTMTRRRDHYLEDLDATRCPYCHSQLCPDRAIGDDCKVDCGREPHDAEVPASAIRPGAGRPDRRPGCPVRGPRRCPRTDTSHHAQRLNGGHHLQTPARTTPTRPATPSP